MSSEFKTINTLCCCCCKNEVLKIHWYSTCISNVFHLGFQNSKKLNWLNIFCQKAWLKNVTNVLIHTCRIRPIGLLHSNLIRFSWYVCYKAGTQHVRPKGPIKRSQHLSQHVGSRCWDRLTTPRNNVSGNIIYCIHVKLRQHKRFENDKYIDYFVIFKKFVLSELVMQ